MFSYFSMYHDNTNYMVMSEHKINMDAVTCHYDKTTSFHLYLGITGSSGRWQCLVMENEFSEVERYLLTYSWILPVCQRHVEKLASFPILLLVLLKFIVQKVPYKSACVWLKKRRAGKCRAEVIIRLIAGCCLDFFFVNFFKKRVSPQYLCPSLFRFVMYWKEFNILYLYIWFLQEFKKPNSQIEKLSEL